MLTPNKSAESLTHQLRGKWRGGPDGYGLCNCVVHQDRHASMTVRNGQRAPLLKCHAGCSSQDIASELTRRGLLNGATGARRLQIQRSDRPRAEPEPDERALSIWQETLAPQGTPVEAYLQSRAIILDIPPSIRFLADPYAMVAAIRRPPDQKIVAVQVTFLDGDGRKADRTNPRLTYGAMGTGAVRLAACDSSLAIAESTEDALSAMQLTGMPCWSAVGGARLHALTLPEIVHSVHVFADSDEAGRKYAAAAVDAYTKQGKKVRTRLPVGAKDWNAYLQQLAP